MEESFKFDYNKVNDLSCINVKDEFIIYDNPSYWPYVKYPHRNDWIIATLCERGYARGQVNLREYKIEANGFILILPGQVIGGRRFSPDFKGKVVLISPRLSDFINFDASYSLEKSVERKPYYVFTKEAVLAFLSFIELCKALILLNGENKILGSLKLLLQGFFVGLEDLLANQVPLPRLSGAHSSDLVEQFLNMVEMEYRQHRNLSYYAEKLCKNVKYLSRIIKESTGKNATDWIDRCVLMDAKAQLVSTHKRMSEISDDLGFSSLSLFGKYFKRNTGLSPKDFRKKNQ